MADLRRWRLGTCIPQGILDYNGLLVEQRNSLSNLSLVTDASCPHIGQCFHGLQQLRALESLEWNGLQHQTEVDALRGCITQNRLHLKKLVIGFAIRGSQFDFSRDVLGLSSLGVSEDLESTSRKSIHLDHLSLTRSTLPASVCPSKATIFHSLRGLTLRGCPEDLYFLNLLSHSLFPVQIKQFELCFDDTLRPNEPERDIQPLLRFLLSFKGLEFLHLKLSRCKDTEQIHSVIVHHRPSLKGLIYHERKMTHGNHQSFENVRDCSPLWLCQLPDILDLSNISSLALNLLPYSMV